MRLSAACGLAAGVMLAGLVASAAALSYQGERDLGQGFDLAARQRLALITDPDVVDYINGIGRKIAATLEPSFFDYQFAVVRDARINAFAVPGGWVYVHGGLLVAAKSDDEVAAVLGHEIGHVHAHHIVRQQEKTAVLSYASLLGMLIGVVQPAAGALTSAASQAAMLQYQRDFEQEADYLGARYMQSAGYDPRAMLDFFKQLSDQQRVSPSLAPPYLQTHPMSDERLNHLEAVLKTAQWKARQRAPISFALQRVQALVRVRLESPADVLAAYRRGVDQHPDNPIAQYLFGLVGLEVGQLDAAATGLDAARAAGVSVADRELGRLALHQRDAARARALLSAYLATAPDDAGARVDLAKAEEALGERDAALAEYQHALALAPWLATAQHGYGLLAGRAGRSGEGFYHLATAARLDGDYATALNQYARAQPLLPAGDPRAEDALLWIASLSQYLKVDAPPTASAEGPKTKD
ncbi:MAG: M48 family metalloprotease [bacterium]